MTDEPKVVAASMTAVVTLSNNPARKTRAQEIEKAMIDATLQAVSQGCSDAEIREAKMEARQRVIDRWNAAAPDAPPG